MNTPISAQGHEPLYQQLTTLNYEMPLWGLGCPTLLELRYAMPATFTPVGPNGCQVATKPEARPRRLRWMLARPSPACGRPLVVIDIGR